MTALEVLKLASLNLEKPHTYHQNGITFYPLRMWKTSQKAEEKENTHCQSDLLPYKKYPRSNSKDHELIIASYCTT
jgi:hypothetical protein